MADIPVKLWMPNESFADSYNARADEGVQRLIRFVRHPKCFHLNARGLKSGALFTCMIIPLGLYPLAGPRYFVGRGVSGLLGGWLKP